LKSLPVILVIAAASASHVAADGDAGVFFENKVRPLLVEHCYRCHSAAAEAKGKLKAGLHADALHGLLKGGDSGSALTPGDPEKSLLVEAVNYGNEDIAMPPKGKLSDAQIAVLTEWVRMGAPWPDADPNAIPTQGAEEEPYDWEKFRTGHWSFKPFVKTAPPQPADADWPRNAIDQFVLTKLESEGLAPNPLAERHALIRRAYLDLIGLPPTPEQVDAFLHDDTPEAFARVVDELLSSTHYGERWARHWLDVARYSDGLGGFGDDKPLPAAWRYRDWVVNALNADMPFDVFVTRQIAGDLLEIDSDPVATGFFVVGPTYQSDGGDPEAKAQADGETLSDRVDTFSRAFLGLTAACARCHHHKFDPITTEDYYAIAGIFRNTSNQEFPVVPQADVDAFHAGQKAIQEQDQRINDFLSAAEKRLGIDRKEIEKSLEEEGKAELAALRAELERRKQSAPPKFEIAHALRDSGNADMHVALRGDLRKPGALVSRRFLEIIAGKDQTPYTAGSGRLELARAVTAPGNPLTARVIVNRVWGWHFGEGLVRTPSNFGLLGEKPTHPELLDWLAGDFVENGWSLKRLHRQILLSATWQMSSAFDKAKFARDGGNRLLWRMNPQRLEIEPWRDTLLAVTGELDRTVGGAPAGEILGSTRRTLYATISRTGDRFDSDAFLRLFDFPAAVSTSEKRVTSTVPQQYLFMMNSPFMIERSKTLGNQLFDLPEPLPERVTDLYLRLYSRPPEPAEIELALGWFGENPTREAWHQYAQVLLSAHELIQIP
jgi:hypothetical protein